MTEPAIPAPPVMWAQKAGIVLVTINLEDCKDPDIKLEKDSIYFKGVGGTDKKLYEVKIALYKEVNPETSKYFNRGRCIEFVLIKAAQNEPYWPHLTSDGKKHHWLKCDFNRWQDEEDSSGDELGGPFGGGRGGGDIEQMMREMGGLGQGGAGASLNDLNVDGEGDSDDEDLPDLE